MAKKGAHLSKNWDWQKQHEYMLAYYKKNRDKWKKYRKDFNEAANEAERNYNNATNYRNYEKTAAIESSRAKEANRRAKIFADRANNRSMKDADWFNSTSNDNEHEMDARYQAGVHKMRAESARDTAKELKKWKNVIQFNKDVIHTGHKVINAVLDGIEKHYDRELNRLESKQNKKKQKKGNSIINKVLSKFR